MHTDIQHNKKPTEDTTSPAGQHTDRAIVPDQPCISKLVATLKARFALTGHTLHSTDPADGPVTYFASRWGMVHRLPTLVDVERLLQQIGGAA